MSDPLSHGGQSPTLSTPPYRGRFAPSPTGPLHFGSLVAAVGSYLQARRAGGQWLVRMEDIDPPREQPGAKGEILRTLERFGLRWDGEVLYQSGRLEAYAAALAALTAAGLTYPCRCSRREIAAAGRCSAAGIYPGTCRTSPRRTGKPPAIRVMTRRQRAGFEDLLQGWFEQDLEREVGDFVLQRADGLFAYQLAVVVDDAAQGITEVVRGSDLLDSTPRQILLQRYLGLPTPRHAHLPLALDPHGQKLSKQSFARPLDPERPLPALWQALRFLGQEPPAELLRADSAELWAWAHAHWLLAKVPRRLAHAAPACDSAPPVTQ